MRRTMMWRRRWPLTVVVILIVGGGVAADGTPSGRPWARSADATGTTRTTRALSAQYADQSEDQAFGYDYCLTVQQAARVEIDPIAASVAGWTNATKLGSAVLLGEPVNGVAVGTETLLTGPEPLPSQPPGITSLGTICDRGILQLDYDGLREFPPVRASVLEYGFMPVTATLTLTQAGPLQDCPAADLGTPACPAVDVVAAGASSDPSFAKAITWDTLEVFLHVSDVDVAGTPLALTGDCQAGPVYTPDPVVDPDNDLLVLSATNGVDEWNGPLLGGLITGQATVPLFTGCVTSSGENLDALFGAGLAGSGNYVAQTQGPTCRPGAQFNCVPDTELPPQAAPIPVPTVYR